MRNRNAKSQSPSQTPSQTLPQTPSDGKDKYIFRLSDLLIKLGIMFVIFFGLCVIELIVVSGRPGVHAMVDHPFRWFEHINQWFHQQEKAGNTLPATCMLMADTLLLGLCASATIFFMLCTPCVRLGTAMILNHSLRAVCMMIVELPEPSKILWRKPGFPSEGENDYFFSGHMALVLISALELWHHGYHKASLLFHVLNVGQCLVFLILQLHYTVDIVTGLLSGFFCFYIIDLNLDAVHKFMYGLVIIGNSIFGVDKLDFSPSMYNKLMTPMMSTSKAAVISAIVPTIGVIVMYFFDCF